jgi:hypothetical protein
MKTWSFYDPATGIFTGRSFSGPERALARNTPAGAAVYPGYVDLATKRLDLATGELVAHRLPQVDRTAERATMHIQHLERKSLRRMRELLLEIVDDPQLKQINDQISARRAEMQQETKS